MTWKKVKARYFNGENWVWNQALRKGHVVVFKGRTGHWVARNLKTGKSTNNAELSVAIREVS